MLLLVNFLDEYFVDNGVLYQKQSVPHQQNIIAPPTDGRTLEFNFLDPSNICCGLCGEIVPYDTLMDEHLPIFHPEVLSDGVVDLEEIPYEVRFIYCIVCFSKLKSKNV